MKLIQKMHLPEWITAGVAFVYYWIMALYKLTEAPIWQDEAMEFYCSIPVKGAIRGVTEYASMYERMAHIQQQPPLYNWVMCLWLQISEGEWWYRFSSVVFGFVAAIGLYLLIRRLTNRYAAAFSVIVFSSIYILMYYVKEASEYIMLIAFLIFTIYAFFGVLEQTTVKRIIVFTGLCIGAVYTHYGAAFAVVSMAVTLLIYFARCKEWKNFRNALTAYAVAGGGAGIPLIVLFILPQSANANSTIGTNYAVELTGNNIIFDFFDSMMWVLRWCMLDYDRDWERLTGVIWVLLFVLIALGIYVFFRTKKKEVRYYLICNVICIFLYYIPTMLTLYAYGWFGNRYNLFILPMWFVLFTIIIYETLMILKEEKSRYIQKAVPYLKTGVVIALILYCMYGDYRIHNHWWKMDFRTTVSEWYAQKGYELPTFLDFHQRYGFVYYFTHDDRYEENQWDNIYSNMKLETYHASKEDYLELLDEVYGENLPDEMLFVTGQWNALMIAVEYLGYDIEPVVDMNVKLYYATKD